MNYKFLNAMMIVAIITGSLGCSAPSSPTPTPTATPAPAATETAASNASPVQTTTPALTASPVQNATPAPAPNRTPSVILILIKSYAFFPPEITINASDKVTWNNKQKNIVILLAEDGSWNSTPMDSEQTFTKEFPNAGVFNYTMKGASAVRGKITVLP